MGKTTDSQGDYGFSREKTWLKTCIEGILFISEKPVKVNDISNVLGVSEKEVELILDELEKEYISERRGFVLRKVGGGFRLYSNPEISEILGNFIKSNVRFHLTQASMETLAIIAYKQPITRTQIAQIRGVKTDSVVLTLLDKGLIEEAGKLKEPGNPILYKTTDKFLELLGINSLKELPPLEEFKEENEKTD
ncbi:MAG: SMC-Scp complex subunit ScpB [Actinobacteria bacterium]|nr:SMC-Scp complex subunit ScpB [Actinomycetota bacterium]